MSIVKGAIADAKTVSLAAEERAKTMFAKEFSPKIKQLLSAVINEAGTAAGGTSTGSDQPGGYNPEEDQDAVGGAVASGQENPNINNQTGDGPQVTYPAANDVKEGSNLDAEEDSEESVDEAEDADMSAEKDDDERFDEGYEEEDESMDPSAEDDLDYVNPSETPSGKEGDEDESVLEIVDDEAVPSIEDEPEDQKSDDVVYEWKKYAKKLKRENKQLKEAIGVLHNKFKKLDLFNAKLAYAYNLLTRPGLNRNQKRTIAEAFDSAKTVREAKIVYNTMKKTIANKPVVRTSPLKSQNIKSVSSPQTKLTESKRMEELAFN